MRLNDIHTYDVQPSIKEVVTGKILEDVAYHPLVGEYNPAYTLSNGRHTQASIFASEYLLQLAESELTTTENHLTQNEIIDLIEQSKGNLSESDKTMLSDAMTQVRRAKLANLNTETKEHRLMYEGRKTLNDLKLSRENLDRTPVVKEIKRNSQLRMLSALTISSVMGYKYGLEPFIENNVSEISGKDIGDLVLGNSLLPGASAFAASYLIYYVKDNIKGLIRAKRARKQIVDNA